MKRTLIDDGREAVRSGPRAAFPQDPDWRVVAEGR